jgi:hypothetical protein
MKIINRLGLAALTCYCLSCNKLVEIDSPTNTIVSEQAFNNDYNANTSINGLYSKLIDQSGALAFGNSATTLELAIYSDEGALFGTDPGLLPFYTNQLLPNDNVVLTRFWQQPYEIIYRANACLEQLENNNNVSSILRGRLIGETKFLRAYCYFYLLNLFGDVPFLVSSAFKENQNAGRASSEMILSSIIGDLENSLNDLPSDYSSFNNEKIRCTKWAAMALLAKLSLYATNWDKADFYSSAVISSNKFTLIPNLNNVFLKNSNEAILQLHIDGTIGPNYNVLPEPSLIIPLSRTKRPLVFLPNLFYNEFDTVDKRRSAWIDSTVFQGTTYRIPYKYKVGNSSSAPGASATEYYMVLRLAEQYLIRSEAKAQKDDLVNAAGDLNIIRSRAGLGALAFISKDDAISKILIERKKELFFEWGNRWLDLKRTSKIDEIMNVATPQKGSSTWKSAYAKFPIPASEIFRNPNLNQNSGY